MLHCGPMVSLSINAAYSTSVLVTICGGDSFRDTIPTTNAEGSLGTGTVFWKRVGHTHRPELISSESPPTAAGAKKLTGP